MDPLYNIFCEGGEGSILHHVQMEKVFPDCKTFVDLKLREDPRSTLAKFEHLKSENKKQPSQAQLREFVSMAFMEGQRLLEVEPVDWTQKGLSIRSDDTEIQTFCQEIHRLWKLLGRKGGDGTERETLLALPNPAIVPGGRFREVYYWDTYWILRGLYASNLHTTARGMIENLIHLLNSRGYVPNGGRLYYTRSQPPLLASCVWDYYKETGDLGWSYRNVESLENEWKYWMENHSITINGHTMFRYNCSEGTPRPESYREDYSLAQQLGDQEKEKIELFKELRTGAESGWDFSSRWFEDPLAAEFDLKSTRIRSILPVDLNAFLYKTATVIADLHALRGQTQKEQLWRNTSERLEDSIESLLWSEDDGIWFDFDIKYNKPRKFFSASNLSPLWTEACPSKELCVRGGRCVDYLEKAGALKYTGGIPTTLRESGEQWDYPNIWPPLEHIIITGLAGTGNERAVEMSKLLAAQTVNRNLAVFKLTGHIFEKYSCEELKGGGGGEYLVQLGFGWTNGVTLDLVKNYM